MRIRGSVLVEVDACKGCALCIDACPQGSLGLSPARNNLGYHYVMLIADNCTGCTNCALVCPDVVITVYRENRKHAVSAQTVTDVQN